jgi:hypothetical protein
MCRHQAFLAIFATLFQRSSECFKRKSGISGKSEPGRPWYFNLCFLEFLLLLAEIIRKGKIFSFFRPLAEESLEERRRRELSEELQCRRAGRSREAKVILQKLRKISKKKGVGRPRKADEEKELEIEAFAAAYTNDPADWVDFEAWCNGESGKQFCQRNQYASPFEVPPVVAAAEMASSSSLSASAATADQVFARVLRICLTSGAGVTRPTIGSEKEKEELEACHPTRKGHVSHVGERRSTHGLVHRGTSRGEAGDVTDSRTSTHWQCQPLAE